MRIWRGDRRHRGCDVSGFTLAMIAFATALSAEFVQNPYPIYSHVWSILLSQSDYVYLHRQTPHAGEAIFRDRRSGREPIQFCSSAPPCAVLWPRSPFHAVEPNVMSPP